MSLLTSASLIEGAIETIIALYESDFETRAGRELTDDENINLEDRATTAFAGVIEDIKDLMNIDSVSICASKSADLLNQFFVYIGGFEVLSRFSAESYGGRVMLSQKLT